MEIKLGKDFAQQIKVDGHISVVWNHKLRLHSITCKGDNEAFFGLALLNNHIRFPKGNFVLLKLWANIIWSQQGRHNVVQRRCIWHSFVYRNGQYFTKMTT